MVLAPAAAIQWLVILAHQGEGEVSILQHHIEAVTRVGRVEWYVGRPALDDPNEARHERDRTIDAQPDSVAGVHTVTAEVVGDTIGQPIELAMGEALIAVLYRRRGRVQLRAPLQPCRDARRAARPVDATRRLIHSVVCPALALSLLVSSVFRWR